MCYIIIKKYERGKYLMTVDEMKKYQWVIYWSGGKDSTATIIKAYELGIPIRKIVYFRMMYTYTTPATLPIMTDFVDYAIQKFNDMGLYVDIINGTPFIKYINKKYQRSIHEERNGKLYGITAVSRKGCGFVHEKQKLSDIENEYQLVGYTVDETKRIPRLTECKQSLLVELGITQTEAKRICQEHGLLSPLYDLGIKRDGCFFCPNAGVKERKYIKEQHPELYDEIKKMYYMCDYDVSSVLNYWIDEIRKESTT